MSGWNDLSKLDLTVRPLDRWPGAPTPDTDRQPSRFDAPLRDTVELLGRELRQLDAHRIVLQVDLRESQLRLDGMPRSDARAASPGVILAFESKHGPLRYACDRFVRPSWKRNSGDDWTHNLRAIALGLEALRTVQRYGIADDAQQYRGYAQLPAGIAQPATHMTTDQAVELMYDLGGLAPDVSDPDSIARAFRFAARRAHPDVGGDPDRFQRLQAAKTLLERESGRG